MRTNKPKIRQRINTSGSLSWCVDAGLLNGQRHRRFFLTKTEALTYAEQVQIAKRNHGAAAFSLSDRQRVEAAEALNRLEPSGASLLEAVSFYLKHATPKGGTKLVNEAVAEFIEGKLTSGKKPRYIKALRVALGIFGKAFGAIAMNQIHRPAFEKWLDERGYALVTRRNYLRDVGMLFSFGVARGYCADNPITQIERPTLDDKPPGIFNVSQAAHLLNTAEANPHLDLIAYVAIGLFAGLRASELEALDWQEIDLAGRTIEVKAKKAKTRRRRIVEVSENLIAWLAPFAKPSGPVVPCGWRDRLQRLAISANLEWPQNVLRHSFASYHLAKHKNAALTALLLGHSDSAMLFAHYRELVKPSAAERYWQLVPTPGSTNVIPLAANA